MREPRQNQRLPEHGGELIENLRAGAKPNLVVAAPRSLVQPQRKAQGSILIYVDSADPYLYFWPVENLHVLAWCADIDSEHAKRLEKALLRDGARWVTLVSGARAPYRYRNVGDMEAHCREHHA